MLAQCIHKKAMVFGRDGPKTIPFGELVLVTEFRTSLGGSRLKVIYDECVYLSDWRHFRKVSDEDDIISYKEACRIEKEECERITAKVSHDIDHLFDGL